MANVIASDVTIAGDKTLSGDITFSGDVVPSSPLSHRNVIINGGMQVAQRGTSSTDVGSAGGYFTVDRFRIDTGNSAGRCTMSQDSDSPNGFANSIKLDCTTADTSIAAGEYFMLQQRIEGQNLQSFAKGTSDAKTFSVSFYVKGNASATYVCELFDIDNTRQVSKSFNVTTSWTRVELTFPADTTGAFGDDNAASLYLIIWLHAGATYTGGTLSTTWTSATSANRAVGISSFFDSTNRTFFITGVQLELGDNATPFENRTLQDELLRCQRYFYMVGGDAGGDPEGASGNQRNYIVGRTSNSNAMYCAPPSAVPMRSTPTVGNFSGSFNINCINKDGATNLNTQPTIDTYNYGKPGNTVGNMYLSGGSGLTDGRVCCARINAAITFDSEL